MGADGWCDVFDILAMEEENPKLAKRFWKYQMNVNYQQLDGKEVATVYYDNCHHDRYSYEGRDKLYNMDTEMEFEDQINEYRLYHWMMWT